MISSSLGSVGSVRRSRRYASMAWRRAIVYSHGPSSRSGSKRCDACHALANVACTTSAALVGSPRIDIATVYTAPPYRP